VHRELERLCTRHSAYRWICGGVSRRAWSAQHEVEYVAFSVLAVAPVLMKEDLEAGAVELALERLPRRRLTFPRSPSSRVRRSTRAFPACTRSS
jgi:hypothetical protein